MSTVVAETLKPIFERDVICNMGAEGASLGASLSLRFNGGWCLDQKENVVWVYHQLTIV